MSDCFVLYLLLTCMKKKTSGADKFTNNRMGMLDATVCDIYLVNESGTIVGRPILTLCVDAYSGVICGYSLSWEGGIYSLRNLMLNVIADKVKHCRKYGIEIEEVQWPSRQLPLKLVTDQGSEYKGENFAQITDLGVELMTLKKNLFMMTAYTTIRALTISFLEAGI